MKSLILLQARHFRAIKARIQFSKIDSGSPKTILVTSPAEQEGKTLISVNLAISYAKSNKKTLLIDCDLRRPRIHSIMNDKKKPGLVDYLFKKVCLDEIIEALLFIKILVIYLPELIHFILQKF